jgi:plastocyanin
MRPAPVHAISFQPGRRFAALALLVVGALIAAGCGGSSNNNPSGSPTTTAPSAAAPTTTAGGSSSGSTAATIQNFAFHPATTNAKAGQKVTWSNDDSTTHTVTADNGSFNSGNLNPNQSFSFTFPQSGSVKYHCSIHSFMHGAVSVS